MRRFAAFCFLFVFSAQGAVAQMAVLSEKNAGDSALAPFKARDWKVAEKPGKDSVATLTQQEIATLVKQLAAKEKGMEKAAIQEFQIKDLNRDGRYEIAAVLGDGCATCPNHLLIISNAKALTAYRFGSLFAHLAFDIIDLDKDNVPEILVRSEFSPKDRAADGFLPWIDVYTWRNGEYVKDNKAFSEFYAKTYIPQRQSVIQRFESLMKEIEAGTSLQAYREEKLKAKTLASLKSGIARNQAAIERVNKEILGK